MRRGTARRRGGSVATTLGFLGVGVSGAVLLAAGTRLLGPAQFSGLGIVWTAASVFGFGVAVPVEQVLSRRLNVGAVHSTRQPLTWLAAAAATFAVAAWVLGSRAAAAQSYTQLVPGILLAVVGWSAVVAVRGRLAGGGDLLAYTAVLAVEWCTRLGLVLAAAAFRPQAGTLLAAAVGLPLLVSASVGALVRSEPSVGRANADVDLVRAEQLGFMVVAFSFQVCINAPPLLLEWKGGPQAAVVVGTFVVANSYFRIPTILMGGVSTHALVALSHAWGARDIELFKSVLSSSLRTMTLWAVGATGIVALAAPWLLPLYNGGPTHLPVPLIVCLAVSTVLAVVAGVGAQPLFAAGHGRWAGTTWFAGAVVTSGFLALSSGTDALAATGLVAGPLVALVGGRWALVRLHLTDARAVGSPPR